MPLRLLHTRTLKFQEFHNPHSVDYAILSHVWDKGGEQSYQEVLDAIRQEHTSSGSSTDSRICEKIRRFCERAAEDGYEWAWIDSCCIDQSSSSEVSESINSMYNLYRHASQCYVFLRDVDDDDDPRQRASQFRRSEWFRRGWTLQELIAPAVLVFLSKTWTPVGTKDSLARVVQQITKIDAGVLKGYVPLATIPVGVRMSWAANRDTTREEDKAYSLLGIFGIHMTPIYGEGHRAFVRLQRAILEHIPDDTLLGWGRTLYLNTPADFGLLSSDHTSANHELGFYAPSPQLFKSTSDLKPIPQSALIMLLGLSSESPYPTIYANTRHGVSAHLPLLYVRHEDHPIDITLGFLPCLDSRNRLLAVILRRSASDPNQLVVGSYTSQNPGVERYFRTVRIDYAALKFWMMYTNSSPRVESLYILPHDPLYRSDPRSDIGRHPAPHRGKCGIIVPSWRKASLAKQGIVVQQTAIDDSSLHPEWCSRRHIIVLSRAGMGAVRIILGFCEHCKPSEIAEPHDFKVWPGFRLQLQSCPDPYDPASLEHDATIGSCRFSPHPSGKTDDGTHVHLWPSGHSGEQGLVLTVDVDFRENGFPTTPTNSFVDSIDEPAQKRERDGADRWSMLSSSSVGLRKLGAEHDPWLENDIEDDSWNEREAIWRCSVSSLPIATNRRQEEAIRATADQWYQQEWYRWGRS
ncbi:HET-domain-containing protein [Dichomitus squalens LYAD-421 SS1]|uniref:HET-domain-containing protein n=1 Tax=Dichomitus squalens (strain LYAD-421) TaxID=732165 RepID=UPI0004413801|nr:HET-domain-containing protein [Dichomitus squalens LYAD-421 SS1]EJF67323.1 HET-domain-containing protein [Dichomitus squalens LYAD-421 SS1]